MKKIHCPEDCTYRNRLVPFCGYCMKEILEEREVRAYGTEQQKAADSEQTGSIGGRYGKENPSARLPGDHSYHAGTEDGHGGYGTDSGTADGDQEPQRYWVSY